MFIWQLGLPSQLSHFVFQHAAGTINQFGTDISQGCTWLRTNYWSDNKVNRGFSTKGGSDCDQSIRAICQLTWVEGIFCRKKYILYSLWQGVPAQHAWLTNQVVTMNVCNVQANGDTRTLNITDAPRWRVQESRGAPLRSKTTTIMIDMVTATLVVPLQLVHHAGVLWVGKIGAVVVAGNEHMIGFFMCFLLSD